MKAPSLHGEVIGWIASNYLQYVDISWIVGMVVAGGLYLIFTRSQDIAGEGIAIERSDAVLAESGRAR